MPPCEVQDLVANSATRNSAQIYHRENEDAPSHERCEDETKIARKKKAEINAAGVGSSGLKSNRSNGVHRSH